MNIVFADPSYYVALLLQTDAHHALAVDCTRTFSGRVLTTQWLLSELGHYLSPLTRRRLFTGILADLEEDPEIVIVSARSSAFDSGATLYADRSDKSWSLADCISFQVMSEYGITDALTTNQHIEQAGFGPLLV